MNRAVFFDKDGTLVENLPFNGDPGRMRLTPGAVEATRQLAGMGWKIIVVTNQPGIALGRLVLRDLDAIHRQLIHLGVPCDGFYACPHAATESPSGGCQCRKPAPGLLLQAAADHSLHLGSSWMIGDILDDVEAGNRAGCRSILFLNGGETLWQRTPARRPHDMTFSLRAAAEIVLQSQHLLPR